MVKDEDKVEETTEDTELHNKHSQSESEDEGDEHLLHHAAAKHHPVDPEPEEASNFEDLVEADGADAMAEMPSRTSHSVGVDPARPKTFGLDHNGGLVTDQLPSSGVYTTKRGNSNKGSKLKTLFLIVIVIAVTGGSVYLLKNKILKAVAPTPSPTPEPTVEISSPLPSATPLTIDRSTFKIRVLNGTSTSGLAASEAAKLKTAGYAIDKTGNASNTAFTQTVVNVKASDQDLLTALIADLAPDFTATGSATLKDSDTVDGEVILGAK